MTRKAERLLGRASHSTAMSADMPGKPLRDGWGRLFFTLGLAALITGIFGLGTEFQRERHDDRVQQCQIAQTLLADDALNADLAPIERRRLEIAASETMLRCFKD